MGEVEEASEKYQGLVPLVYDIETMALEVARPEDMYYAVYLKREADKEFRKLHRALWLARVDRAISMSCIDMYSKYKEKHPFTVNQSFDEWALIWQVVERKCRACADKFK